MGAAAGGQEVAAEGLVRNLPAFSSFLDAAALSDGDPVNYSNIARDCGVSSPTVKAYFGILNEQLTYWGLPSKIEVDFVIGDMRLAIEAKATANVTRKHLKGLRTLAEEHPGVRRMVVCLEPRPRRTDDGIDIVPATDFAHRLWQGDIALGVHPA